jgi:hypothetical protein
MKGTQNARKHGHYGLKVKLTGLTLGTVSQQNGMGRAVVEKGNRIIADRGGRESLSELKLDLIDRYLKTELLIHSIDSWMFQQKSLINRRKRSLYPILAERNRLVETSLKLAQAIGLDREERKVPMLADYIAQKNAEKERESSPETRPESCDEPPGPKQ